MTHRWVNEVSLQSLTTKDEPSSFVREENPSSIIYVKKTPHPTHLNQVTRQKKIDFRSALIVCYKKTYNIQYFNKG